MQPRIPRQPAPEDGCVPGEGAGLGAELAAVVTAARRRAVRDADRHTDTAHLLHALLEADPEVRAALGDGPLIARLLGYLVQRSIGYGLRWRGSVEDSGALPVFTEDARPTADGRRCSPAARAALAHARRRAARHGRDAACGLDLLAGLLADPRSRAAEVLTRAGACPDELAARLDDDARTRPHRTSPTHGDHAGLPDPA